MHPQGFLATVLVSLTGLELIAASAIPVPEAVDVLVPRHERRQVPESPPDANTTNPPTGTKKGLRNPGDKVDCSDIRAGRNNECWAQLDLTAYVKDWIVAHECKQGEAFATCYLRQNGFGSVDCTGLNPGSCPPPVTSGNSDVKNLYVAYNIYGINNFFRTWYDAVAAAAETAEDNIPTIVKLLDSSNAGLSLQADLTSTLSKVTTSIRSNINQTTTSVLSNYTEFLAFAEQGKFSADLVSLPDATNYLTYAFNTYLASTALVESDIYLTVSRDTDVVKLATNGTTLAYPLPECAAGLNKQGVCDTWYYSKNYDSTFGLVSRSKPQTNYAKLTDSLLTDLTSGELLFESSLACGGAAGREKSVGPSALPNVTLTVNGVNTACISVLDTYEWDKQCQLPAAGAAPDCELVDVPAGTKVAVQKGFLEEGQGGVRSVPPAYLGPAIAQTQVKLSRD